MACVNLLNKLVDAKQSDNFYKNRKLLKVYSSFFFLLWPVTLRLQIDAYTKGPTY